MKAVEVILCEHVPSLGNIGEIVRVAPGYARNYLIPRGLALPATGKNIRELEHRKMLLAKKREEFRKQMLSVAEKLNNVTLTMVRKVAEGDKLYGSVSATDILEALEEQGFTGLAKKNILLDQPIKKVGEFKITIKVESDIKAQITVLVVPEGAETPTGDTTPVEETEE
ncbi:50S ribosomal protein L9 [Thermodesulforhabdus norvegica]|uniref:Large ribosomal subunit protein bL9 n=1 Tax=Thermodesulforhabdus norvegica TaxID=39841 RepID=A0A1I4U8U4_9BACT|nr:50S ribosomal protein L9 [Thermodesulforhabdus norvegica]SFM85382.1 LSU ribosomal protein L9P [Thermodesulforhabdus norvegica]